MPVVNSTLYAWDVLKPISLHFLESLKQIALVDKEGALLLSKCGDVYAIGKSTTGWLGLGNVTETEKPMKIEKLSNVEGVNLCNMYGNALAFTKDGKLYTWGHNDRPNCDSPTLNCGSLENVFIVDAQCVGGFYIALTKDGKVYEWNGVQFYNNAGQGPTPPKLKTFDTNPVIVSIACSQYHYLALDSNGNIYWWGYLWNYNQGTRVYTVSPSLCSIPGEVVCKIFCGQSQNLVLTKSSKLFTWGYNPNYLGSGTSYSASPVELKYGTSRFVDCFVSCHNTCAAKLENGAIVIFGSYFGNSYTALTLFNFGEMHEVFANKSTFLMTFKTTDTVIVHANGQLFERITASFNDKETCDLTIKVDDKRLYLHRYILNACSNFFRVLLQNHWTSKNESEIVLTSFRYEVYESYFWYLYSGEIKSDLDNLLELGHIADLYDEPDLKKGVLLLIERNLKFENLVNQYVKEMTLKSVKLTASSSSD